MQIAKIVLCSAQEIFLSPPAAGEEINAADEKWLRFVSENRNDAPPSGDWDLIHGPVANDQTMPVITLFLDGFYDEKETIKRLLPQNLKDQYVFKTNLALSMLNFREAILP